MQSYRIYTTTPSTARVALRRAPSSCTSRNMAAYCTPFGYRVARRSAPAPSFFPSLSADFSPFLRMFDELESLTSAAATSNSSGRQQSLRSYQPKFDVREEQDAYHLQGELPGVSQDDLSIEFTDPTTLVVRGRTVREHQAGTPPQAIEHNVNAEATPAAVEAAPAAEPERAASPASSESGSNYQRPSVEEDRDDEEWTEAVPTPATANVEAAPEQSNAVQKAPEQPQPQPEAQPQQQQDNSHYWVSERSVGTFQRTFNFPGQVDQEAVTASLKDGILNVVVPKQQPRQPRKITIQ